METEIDIQKCKKILFDEFGQNDAMDKEVDRLFELLEKVNVHPTCNSLNDALELIAGRYYFAVQFIEYLKKES